MNYFLLLIPVINATFGWWIIETLIRFVFRPYDAKNILGISVQGLLPSIQNEIARKAGEWATQNFNEKKIEEYFLSKENLDELHKVLELKAEDFIRNKLTERISLLKMFITESMIVQAKEVLVEQLDEMIPEFVKNFSPKISSSINIQKEVESRILNYPIQHLENEIQKAYSKKIFLLKITIAVVGFLLGIIEVAFVFQF